MTSTVSVSRTPSADDPTGVSGTQTVSVARSGYKKSGDDQSGHRPEPGKYQTTGPDPTRHVYAGVVTLKTRNQWPLPVDRTFEDRLLSPRTGHQGSDRGSVTIP